MAIGDIVAFTSPINPKVLALKRVIGLSGDTIYKDPRTCLEKVTVPEGMIWVSGDNIGISRDSSEYGPISEGLLHATIPFRLYPHLGPTATRIELTADEFYKQIIDD